MYCDSMVALAHPKDPKYHRKSKHIQTCYNYIHLAITQGEVILQHISTSRMVVDPLLKPLLEMPFRLMLGVWDFVGFDMFLDTSWTFIFCVYSYFMQ